MLGFIFFAGLKTMKTDVLSSRVLNGVNSVLFSGPNGRRSFSNAVKHRNSILIAVFSAILVSFAFSGIFAPKASAQTVDNYIVTSPTLTWTDLSSSGGNEIYGEIFYYTYTTTQLPFDFKYDNTTIPAGTTIYISGGNLRFGNAPAVYQSDGGLGNTGYTSDLVYWGGPYITAGSGQN